MQNLFVVAALVGFGIMSSGETNENFVPVFQEQAEIVSVIFMEQGRDIAIPQANRLQTLFLFFQKENVLFQGTIDNLADDDSSLNAGVMPRALSDG